MNTLYPAGREGILDESIQLRTGNICVALVESTYTYDPAHQVVADMDGKTNGRSGPLTGKTFAGGAFDADDTELRAAVPVMCNAMVVYQDAGNDHEARLIAYLAGNGLPFLPVSEQRVLLEWDNGPGRIFRWRMNGDGDCDA